MFCRHIIFVIIYYWNHSGDWGQHVGQPCHNRSEIPWIVELSFIGFSRSANGFSHCAHLFIKIFLCGLEYAHVRWHYFCYMDLVHVKVGNLYKTLKRQIWLDVKHNQTRINSANNRVIFCSTPCFLKLHVDNGKRIIDLSSYRFFLSPIILSYLGFSWMRLASWRRRSLVKPVCELIISAYNAHSNWRQGQINVGR